ncbi:creatininase family protein [Candidatus Nitrosocosmicus arcticus]|uniref:Creatinine amidohydrolase/formamide hydrolase n=1 Tax=Candidatus Nitrosocosmicus arcticus TaxID=2035267 RepID=A0A557SS19_9ARCH|nr:creatininase family protein [Candidatus Nitrosocosmicus arcticus]TVP39389.1 creatinine amidohydrolase/formamide hydrolase [Candidatus Nitrosocosmicus arcticus]
MEIKNISQNKFSSLIKDFNFDSAILPLGSIEQHGDHLPFSTDTLIVEHISNIVSIKSKAFLLPSIFYGVSYEHEPLFNVSIDYNILVDFISCICQSLSMHGIKRIYVINGHHGNIGLLQYVGQNLLSKYAMNSDFFYFINYWQMLETGFDHAGEVETSIMMALHPNLVRMDLAQTGLDIKGQESESLFKLGTNMSINNPAGFVKFTKNGIWGNPFNADAMEGKKMLSQVIEKILSLIIDPKYK